ncbi:MAG: hypothetical protein WBV94_08860 [Blastocatellia bacterium]
MSDSQKEIRGLSLTRPWPFAFVNGPPEIQKRVENRSWLVPAHLRGCYIALHAAKSWDEGDREIISDALGIDVPAKAESAHTQIFAVCQINICAQPNDSRIRLPQRRWVMGPYVWICENFVKLIEPVICTGAQGLWTFDQKQDELKHLRKAYREAKLKQDADK